MRLDLLKRALSRGAVPGDMHDYRPSHERREHRVSEGDGGVAGDDVSGKRIDFEGRNAAVFGIGAGDLERGSGMRNDYRGWNLYSYWFGGQLLHS